MDTNPTDTVAPLPATTDAATRPARAARAAAPDAGTITLRHRRASTSDRIDFDGVEIPRGATHDFSAADAKRALQMVDDHDRRYFEHVTADE